MNFLTYRFLRFKWPFAKSVKISKETVIYKNRYWQSFKKRPVYNFVLEEVKSKVEFVMICWEQYLMDIFHKL